MNDFESLGDKAGQYAERIKKKQAETNQASKTFQMNQRECARVAKEIILPVFEKAKQVLDKKSVPCRVLSDSTPSELFATRFMVQSPNGTDWNIFTFHTNQNCETFQSGEIYQNGNWKTGSPHGWGYGGVDTALVTRELKAFLNDVLN